ncbi:MAG: MBL fold metallo-hydrolase [Planctomycetota bacterium]|nr:MAG: MBL fold metallo-hydrolase [Planctomycetota bacterium]
MTDNNKYLASLLLFALLIGSVHFIGVQVLADGPEDAKSKLKKCDLKKTVKPQWCPQCKTHLLRLKCEDCELNKCEKCSHHFQIKVIPPGKTKTVKCSCCSGRNLAVLSLKAGDKCLSCRKTTRAGEVEYCLKRTYACPDHPDYKNLKPDMCREENTDPKSKKKRCLKKLVLVEVDYAGINAFLACPACQKKSEEAGKCGDCKKDFKEEKVCRNSGTFPHMNELRWSMALKKKSSSSGSEGGDKDQQTANSKPEVKVFEGTRRPVQRSWTYLIYCPKKKEAALVDASCDADALARFLKEKKLKLKYIFISHGHGDHVVTMGQIRRQFRGAKILRFRRPLKDNDYIKIGKVMLKIFHTPGHSADCIVIWTANMLFTGDSYDRPVGREETAKRLKGKGSFTIYGGHGKWQDSY